MEGEEGVSKVLKDRLMWFAVISVSSEGHPRAFFQVICLSLAFAASPCSSPTSRKSARPGDRPPTPNPGPYLALLAEGVPGVSVLGLSEARAHPTPQRLSLRGQKTQGLGIRGTPDPT